MTEQQPIGTGFAVLFVGTAHWKEVIKMILMCKECGKMWKGRTEHEAEVKSEQDPCECDKKYSQMSTEELNKLMEERRSK